MSTLSNSLPLEPVVAPLRVDEGGTIRIGNTRITLGLVVGQYENGMTPEDMVRAYDTLVLSDVYTVIAYYLQHRDEVRAYLKQREDEAEALQAKIEAAHPPVSRDELIARRSAGASQMLRLATDADVRGEIIRGLRRRVPEIDLVRAQQALPDGTSDSEVLAWAAAENRVLITNDRNTMIDVAFRRVVAREPMPGLIVTTNEQSSGSAIDDILLIAECMPEEEARVRIVVFLPLQG